MFIMRLNFLYYICFAFFHICLKMEFLKNQKCVLYSGLAGTRLPWLEEEDGTSLKPVEQDHGPSVALAAASPNHD